MSEKVGRAVMQHGTIQRWIAFNEEKRSFWSAFFVILISVSFILSDWMLGAFTFSEYILGFGTALMMGTGQYRVHKKQWKWALLPIALVGLNVLFHTMLNEAFDLKAGIAGFVKVAFYVVVLVGSYNFIKDRKLEREFLLWNNRWAAIVFAIGLYIMAAIYLNNLVFNEGIMPFRFIWKFTRSDWNSYMFYNESIQFVRMRSIFSEPSYLGFYLNTVLALNYFNKQAIRVPKYFSVLISIAIVLTFSYSAIGIMLAIQILFLIKRKERIRHLGKWKIGGALIGVIILCIVLWDVLSLTLFERTIQILQGEDSSSIARLFSSWQYTNAENLLIGNGIGHTPPIWNVYAYILSDLGLVAFIAALLFTGMLFTRNWQLGIVFVLLNFAKGGYLSSSFWVMVLLILIYAGQFRKNQTIK